MRKSLDKPELTETPILRSEHPGGRKLGLKLKSISLECLLMGPLVLIPGATILHGRRRENNNNNSELLSSFAYPPLFGMAKFH